MITLSTMPLSEFQTSHLPGFLFAYEDAGIAGARHLTPSARKQLLDLAKAEGFKGGLGECVSVSWNGKKSVFVGLGKRKECTRETQRRAAGSLWGYAKSRFEAIAVAPEDWLAVAQGVLLASYRFTEYKKGEADKLTTVRLVVAGAPERNAADKAIARALLEAEAVFLVRDLVNRAPSDKTPESLAELARGLEGVDVEVVDKEKAKELGMGSFLGVARGSSVDPMFVHLAYKPRGAKKKIGIVGKGITFDSGGLSLKVPSTHMETMKCDMAGAATVLGVMRVLPKLKPKVEVHGYCAFTYNMPGPDAVKPGDILTAMNGKTIEVLNTDAEGRLVLADALVYATTRQQPDAVIDLATLTGAVVVALGSKVTGVMGNHKGLMRQLMAASERCEEAFCELPLPRDYRDQIKGGIADLQNIGKVRGEAGSIIGGLFLQEFVGETPWAHLDIAGTAWQDSGSSYCPAGGTGSVVRTLLDYLGSL
jgi:leucyl aminopeptidase